MREQHNHLGSEQQGKVANLLRDLIVETELTLGAMGEPTRHHSPVREPTHLRIVESQD